MYIYFYILPLLGPSSEDDCLGVLLGLLTAAASQSALRRET